MSDAKKQSATAQATGPAARLRHFAHPRIFAVAVALGTLLAAPSVGPHLVLDDFILLIGARGHPVIDGLPAHGLDLFSFTTGRPADNFALMDEALMLPWWTDPEIRVAFFRPIAALTHQLDVALWPDSPTLMHLHSLGWLALSLALVAAVYARFETVPWIAGLATVLYAIDDARGPTVAWLSNRNALLAVVLGCAALLAHDRARRDGRRSAAIAAPLWLGAALLSAELAAGVLAYLLAYAVFLDRGSRRERVTSLVPYGFIVVAWRAGYSRAHYGAHGSGVYIDPFRDPLSFAAALPGKLVALLGAQAAGPPSDLVFLGPPETRPALYAAAALSVLVFGLLVAPIVRSDKVARFWAGGALLSAFVGTASFPSDRLLPFVGLGAMGLVARVLGRAMTGEVGTAPRLAAAGFAAVHLVVAPLSLPLRAAQMEVFGRMIETATRPIYDSPDLANETVVLINPPTVLFANYLQGRRAWNGETRPRHLYFLSSASSPLTVTRAGPNELVVEPEAGFLFSPLERHYRGATRSLPAGSTVTLSSMRAEIRTVTADGRPQAVDFVFDRPLDTPSLRFFIWRRGGYEPFTPPPAGASVHLPREDFGAILAGAGLEQLSTAF